MDTPLFVRLCRPAPTRLMRRTFRSTNPMPSRSFSFSLWRARSSTLPTAAADGRPTPSPAYLDGLAPADELTCATGVASSPPSPVPFSGRIPRLICTKPKLLRFTSFVLLSFSFSGGSPPCGVGVYGRSPLTSDSAEPSRPSPSPVPPPPLTGPGRILPRSAGEPEAPRKNQPRLWLCSGGVWGVPGVICEYRMVEGRGGGVAGGGWA